MKAIFLTALFVLTSLVTGCDQIRQFDVSEKVINDYLSQKNSFHTHSLMVNTLSVPDLYGVSMAVSIFLRLNCRCSA